LHHAVPIVTSDTLAIILGGGQGARLFPLTATRSKPAVPIGGKYRLIDIPVSGCLHAEIRRIFVLTQFNSASLNRHISNTYQLDRFSGGFVEILALVRRPTTALVGTAVRSPGCRASWRRGLLPHLAGDTSAWTAS
jgi:glucose-1-phosphate adenylyltransferase